MWIFSLKCSSHSYGLPFDMDWHWFVRRRHILSFRTNFFLCVCVFVFVFAFWKLNSFHTLSYSKSSDLTYFAISTHTQNITKNAWDRSSQAITFNFHLISLSILYTSAASVDSLFLATSLYSILFVCYIVRHSCAHVRDFNNHFQIAANQTCLNV